MWITIQRLLRKSSWSLGQGSFDRFLYLGQLLNTQTRPQMNPSQQCACLRADSSALTQYYKECIALWEILFAVCSSVYFPANHRKAMPAFPCINAINSPNLEFSGQCLAYFRQTRFCTTPVIAPSRSSLCNPSCSRTSNAVASTLWLKSPP